MARNKNKYSQFVWGFGLGFGTYALILASTGGSENSPEPKPTATATKTVEAKPSPSPEISFAIGQCVMQGKLPDPVCTPGALNPNVTQANISTTICHKGYSGSIRPPVEYTNDLKRKQMKWYGFTDSITKHEEDHLIPLSLGGSPASPLNLWPEPDASPNAKDDVEFTLYKKVCADEITLHAAQVAILDWTTALQKVG